MIDPAAMHLVIANAAMHRKELLGKQDEDFVELFHVGAAMTSVNERIGDPTRNIADAMLGAVLGVREDYSMTVGDLCRANILLQLMCHDVSHKAALRTEM
jgi:hypothetical protein